MTTVRRWSVTSLCALGLLASVGSVEASVISMNTRFSGAGPQASAAAYKALIDGLTAGAPGGGYCDALPVAYTGLSNQVTCGGGGTNIAFHFGVDFGVSAAEAGAWSIRVGPDFGLGGAVFLDGVAVGYNSSDMWWAGSYSNPTQIFSLAPMLAAGNHRLDVYGLEGCCDGGQQAQYLRPGDTFYTTFSTTDGLNRVPEPATVALVGTGLALLAFRRSRRR